MSLQPLILTRTATTGLGARTLARQAKSGELVRLRAGVYLETGTWNALAPWDKDLHRIRACAESFRSRTVFCRDSAALLWHLPLRSTTPVHAYTSDARGGRSRNGVVRHHVPDGGGDAVQRYGVLVSSRVRTVQDLLVYATFPDAIMATDHALNGDAKRGFLPLGRTEILEGIEELYSADGCKRLTQRLAFADPASGSPGESLSRAMMEIAGFARPRLQHEFYDRQGLVARTDFDWPAPDSIRGGAASGGAGSGPFGGGTFGASGTLAALPSSDSILVGEFDGAVKYQKIEYTNGRSASEIVQAEKRREDRIRALGPRVIRWGWQELQSLDRFNKFLSDSGVPRRPSRSALA
ncbi:hypothetical protein ACQR35_01455 [Pseudarthrobacter sp. J1738]|uniref:hypothetical protein n=1 Tax=unclassified Pseudarthrobacter TaxID=2647000 RepID=UPI003D29FF19